MAKIDTVIFDIGNVLIRWDMYNLYRRMFPNDSAIKAFLDETGLVKANIRFDAGEPMAQGIEALVARFPQYRDAIRAFDHRWTDCLDGAIEENVAVLRDLDRKFYDLHAITNFSAEKFPVAVRMFPFLLTFEETIVSGVVKLIKPDPAIFQLLIDRLQLDTARAVFIDDSAANVATANELGFNTVHLAKGADLRTRLVALGVEF